MEKGLRIGLPLMLAAALAAGGATVSDDFESYVVGSNIHGQNGWQGWDNVESAGATVSSAFAYSPTRSISVAGSSDLVHTFSGINSGLWTLSIKQYVPSTSTGNAFVILLNTYNNGGPYDWSVQIQNNMDTGRIISDNGGGATLTMVKDAWVEYRFDIDLTGNTVTEYYNNQLLSTHAWQTAGANALAAMDLYANNGSPIYYDDLVVVPEPGTLGMLALGGLALLARRTRQTE